MNAFILLAALTVFKVDPWCNEPFLPNADPKGGVKTDTISFAAAKGEIEAFSFVVLPDRDYPKVDVVVSDLAGPGGKIAADRADVSLVKVWFRPDSRWNSSWRGNQAKPVPINNLILHDDALVRVDWEKKVNYLRGSFPDGDYYMDMSHTDKKTFFNNDCQPIHDAPKFVPFDLKKDFRQQYLVTWKVPAEARPGKYMGKVRLVSNGTSLATLSTTLEVYPFVLPSPRTHYDTTQPYYSFWMGSPSLSGLVSGGHRLDRAERKCRAIFRSLYEHNAVNLSGVGTLKNDSMDDLALRTLIIARQEGLSANPLLNGMSFDFAAPFVCSPGDPKGLLVAEEHPEKYAESLKRFREEVMAQNRIMDKYLGHHRSIRSSADECGVGTNRRGYGYWNIVHELGGYTWTDYAYSKDSGIFIDMNDVPGHVAASTGWEWHKAGAKAVTYASTFTGPENPDVWRRIKGLRFWYNDHDGQHEYCFFDGRANRWNDFVHYDRYCQFGIVYWTDEGLVSTLAWEAVREALDDVKYFTLLRLSAEKALASADAATKRLGREALVWQDGIDTEYVIDLNDFRAETVKWILKLQAKVGPLPAEKDPELPPPELPPDSQWKSVPPKGSTPKAIFAFADKHSGNGSRFGSGTGRFDLAIAALENLYKDPKADAHERAVAAIRASRLHSAICERPAAVKAVETVLPEKSLKGADRGKLLLQRVNAMMSDEKFEEKYTVRQLDVASSAIAEALKFPGASEDERAAAVQKMTDGYLAAGDAEKCIEYAFARMKDVRIDPAHLAYLYITVAEAYKKLENWKDALKAFSDAHRAFNNDKDKSFRRRILISEAEAAEKDKDYVRALNCWIEMVPTYDSTEEQDKIKAAQAQVARLSPLARKANKVNVGSLDDDDSSDPISLDE